MSGPTLTVNPLSAIAPGILRRILGAIDGTVSRGGAPEPAQAEEFAAAFGAVALSARRVLCGRDTASSAKRIEQGGSGPKANEGGMLPLGFPSTSLHFIPFPGFGTFQ